MKKFPKVHILLSTYNGEKYLAEQLDSIFKQTYQNFILYIRDDGSSDSTVKITYEYIEHHPEYEKQIVILPNVEKQNLGYMGSFWKLLDECGGADYYAFCDQDDIWFPGKIEAGVHFLEKEVSQIPLLYFSNYQYCDEHLNILHEAPQVKMPIHFQDVLFYTPAFGFSIIVNEELRKMALKTVERQRIPHDGWVQKIAAAFGKILYNPEYMALYRRHGKAVTYSNVSKVMMIKNWIKNDIFGSAMKENRYVLQRFLDEYKEALSEEDKELLKLVISNNIKRVFYKERFRPSIGGEMALRICFLLNTGKDNWSRTK